MRRGRVAVHQVQGLERSVSRALSTAISSVAKQHPSPLTDALLLPLVLAPALGTSSARATEAARFCDLRSVSRG
jgi:hypothetical protein